MHKKEVRWVLFLAYLLDHSRSHRHSRYSSSPDHGIDLSLGHLAHELSKEDTTGSTDGECDESQSNDAQGLRV